MELSPIIERQRLASPAPAPQALTWHSNTLWMGSRDLRRIYSIDPKTSSILQENDPPGIPWAAVSANGSMFFTIGEGADDDRYVYRYSSTDGFSKMFECPEFTGSYLSYDGVQLFLSH